MGVNGSRFFNNCANFITASFLGLVESLVGAADQAVQVIAEQGAHPLGPVPSGLEGMPPAEVEVGDGGHAERVDAVPPLIDSVLEDRREVLVAREVDPPDADHDGGDAAHHDLQPALRGGDDRDAARRAVLDGRRDGDRRRRRAAGDGFRRDRQGALDHQPDRRAVDRAGAEFEDLVAGRWDYLPVGLLCFTHFRFFTRQTLADMLRAAGLHDFEIVAQRSEAPAWIEDLPPALEIDGESLSTTGFYVVIRID